MGFKADAILRRPPVDPNLPTNVGARAGQFEGTATLLASRDGDWEYRDGPELPIAIVPNQTHELPFSGLHVLYWSGIEVTVNIDELRARYGDSGGRGAARYFVVAALHPARCGWVVCAPLRGENKHLDVEHRNEEILRSVISGVGLRDLSWDPFLRGKREFAARLNDPMRLHYRAEQNLDNGFVIGREPAELKGAVWHFGICPAGCLEAFGIDVDSPAISAIRNADGGGAVRAPRSKFDDLAQAAALFACAGRREGDSIPFQQVRSQAEKELASFLGEEG